MKTFPSVDAAQRSRLAAGLSTASAADHRGLFSRAWRRVVYAVSDACIAFGLWLRFDGEVLRMPRREIERQDDVESLSYADEIEAIRREFERGYCAHGFATGVCLKCYPTSNAELWTPLRRRRALRQVK